MQGLVSSLAPSSRPCFREPIHVPNFLSICLFGLPNLYRPLPISLQKFLHVLKLTTTIQCQHIRKFGQPNETFGEKFGKGLYEFRQEISMPTTTRETNNQTENPARVYKQSSNKSARKSARNFGEDYGKQMPKRRQASVLLASQ